MGKGQEEIKKNLDKYVSIGQLKYYFAVDNSYVGKKLGETKILDFCLLLGGNLEFLPLFVFQPFCYSRSAMLTGRSNTAKTSPCSPSST